MYRDRRKSQEIISIGRGRGFGRQQFGEFSYKRSTIQFFHHSIHETRLNFNSIFSVLWIYIITPFMSYSFQELWDLLFEIFSVKKTILDTVMYGLFSELTIPNAFHLTSDHIFSRNSLLLLTILCNSGYIGHNNSTLITIWSHTG